MPRRIKDGVIIQQVAERTAFPTQSHLDHARSSRLVT